MEEKGVAGYVQKLVCTEWPGWAIRPRQSRSRSGSTPGARGDGRRGEEEGEETKNTLSPLFIKALMNMPALTSLTLPSIYPLLPSLLPPLLSPTTPTPAKHSLAISPSSARFYTTLHISHLN